MGRYLPGAISVVVAAAVALGLNVAGRPGLPAVHTEQTRQALPTAVERGDLDAVASLLRGGADVNAVDEMQWTALHTAAWNGDTPMVAVLLQGGATVDARTGMGWTPLHLAALAGHSSTVVRLIEGGAGLGATTRGGLTPLKLAVRGRSAECAEVLRRNGACE